MTNTNRGGPCTENGKMVVRWNATRHGISSPAPVVPGLEKGEDWQEHRNGILDNLSPVGHLEFTLAERVALLSWRLHRVTRYETEAITLSQEQVEVDVHMKRIVLRSFRENPYASTHPADIRFEAKHDRQTHTALKRFPSLEPGEILKGEDASAVVQAVLVAAQQAVEGETGVESLDLPGVPEDACIEELPAMKAKDVRGCVEAIAGHVGEDTEKVLEVATEAARSARVSSEYKRKEVEKEVSCHKRERILPDGKTLEKIARYEAHLSRQLYHALHELENLQKHRTSGEGVPLTRLDVQ